MDPRNAPVRSPRTRRLGGVGASVLILSLVVGSTAAGCADGGDRDAGTDGVAVPSATQAADAAQPVEPAAVEVEVPIGHMHMPTAEEVTETWKTRPAYVESLPADWQSAYAFALARPDVLQWLPCYCGCGAMGHGSNLDCFFQRREIEGNYQWEEHGSYCDICVETANLASSMLRDGSTMIQIRAAVDVRFGGTAPGTDTELPPA